MLRRCRQSEISEGETKKSSILIFKLSVLYKVDLVPTRRNSVLSLLCLRKFAENHYLFSATQRVRTDGEEGNLGRQIELGIVCVTVKMDIESAKDYSKRKKIDNEKKGPQDRTLGHPSGNRGRLGSEGFKLDELSAVRQI